ncbi:uncharacterized protein LOC113853532 [Abrus precatorius]|uniref:Uncharacterized protein LOC113853532 n=1 Tax=Abrus precatorius TaxID=3816 RepID=A0A8B8K7S7_ABRPR|nr:uncharacterized protein LOC113853532 [Abrus precatorius]
MNLLHPGHHVFRIVNERNWGGGRSKLSEREIAARDRVINFGKYKGKMLGSLPSKYLKWVSKNLRAGHFEEWAKLADKVLEDPIYGDRIEWELALNVLSGNSCSSRRPTSAVCELQDISERFGWDNLDKVGWAKVDFDLLGTSKSARIPRLVHNVNQPPLVNLNPSPPPLPPLSRRMERRERQRMRLRTQPQPQPQSQQLHEDPIAEQDDNGKQNHDGIPNPFPGRQALLGRAIIHHSRHKQSHNI